MDYFRAAQRDHNLAQQKEVEKEKTEQAKEKTKQEKEKTAREIRMKTIELDIEKEKTTQKQHDAKIGPERERTAQLKMYLELIEKGVPAESIPQLLTNHTIDTNLKKVTNHTIDTNQKKVTNHTIQKKVKARGATPLGKQRLVDGKGT